MDRKKYSQNRPPVVTTTPTPEKKAKAAPKVALLLWPGLIAAAIAFLVYAQTLGYGYALDDYSVILENTSTKLGIGEIGMFFKTSLRHGYIFLSDELYRPLTKSVYALQWSISKENPFIGHLMNVSLFTLTCFLVYIAVSRWTSSIISGFVTAVLFAVMPVHTEAVANIKSIDEILAFLFGIFTLHSFYRFAKENNTTQRWMGMLWFFLALCSKESSITLVPVVPLVIYFFTENKKQKLIASTVSVAIIALLFLAIRASVLGPNTDIISAADNMLMMAKEPLTRKITAIAILGRYLWVTIAGFPLSFDLSFPALKPLTASDPLFLGSVTVLTGLLIVAVILFKRKDPLAFPILFFFITVSVSSNIFLTIGTHWGERLMYMPSLGICMAVALLADRYIQKGKEPAKRTVLLGITALITIVSAGMTIARNPVWKDNEALYKSGLISAPKSARVQYYMGNHLGKDKQTEGKTKAEKEKILKEAIAYLDTSLALYPPFADAWNQKGLCYYRLKDYQKAAESYMKGLAINPNDAVMHNNFGTVMFDTGKYREAIEEFNKSVSLNPNYIDGWSNLGSAYGTVKQFDDAINAFNRTVAIDPGYARGWYFLGLTWRYKGDESRARQYLDKAHALDPSLQ